MNYEQHHKIQAQQLQRNAYLYVRQSTLHQVLENTESTQRQYALRDRAVALGWPLEKVIVIDSDLGQSGASAADREGFQRLVTEVGLGHAGIVLGLEVSRLARNCADWQEADRLRRQQVERARYEADLAQQRFMQVDPKNRLVADALEADWNNRLRALAEAEEHYQQQGQADRNALNQKSKEQILALAADFPRLWHDPKTPDRERKRMVRLLSDAVTLFKAEGITAQVRFKGGTKQTLTLPLPLPAWMTWQTNPETVALIDRLLDEYTDGQIAQLLNDQGRRSGKDRPFTRLLIGQIRRGYQLEDRYRRLRRAGMLTQQEMADDLGVARSTVSDWRRSGLLKAHAYNDKNQYLYERMDRNKPHKAQGIKLTDPRRFTKVAAQLTKEVQDEA